MESPLPGIHVKFFFIGLIPISNPFHPKMSYVVLGTLKRIYDNNIYSCKFVKIWNVVVK